MPRTTKKTNLQTAQEKIKTASSTATATQEPVKIDPLPVALKSHQSSAYGGVNLPSFDPNQFIATDLFTDCSLLPISKQADIDRQVESIEGKRQTLRLMQGNINLNIDVLKTASLHEKQSQQAVIYGTDKINTSIKEVGYNSALISLETANVKLLQNQEKLQHEGIQLTGLQSETPLRQLFWTAKLQLIESRIKQVELAKYQLDAKIGAIETESMEVV